MKLISRFHDYYDGVLAQGRDEAVLYLRQTACHAARLPASLRPWTTPAGRQGRAVGIALAMVAPPRILGTLDPTHAQPSWRTEQWRNQGLATVFHEAFVLVAGQAHGVWLRSGCGNEIENPAADLGAPSMDLVVARENARRACLHGRIEPVQALVCGHSPAQARAYAAARQALLAGDYTALHLRYEAPVLLLANPGMIFDRPRLDPIQGQPPNALVVANPRLASLAFASALDPYSCFQAISQFISGVVPGQQMPMIEISDRSKVQKHGFDLDYGFRTRPA